MQQYLKQTDAGHSYTNTDTMDTPCHSHQLTNYLLSCRVHKSIDKILIFNLSLTVCILKFLSYDRKRTSNTLRTLYIILRNCQN